MHQLFIDPQWSRSFDKFPTIWVFLIYQRFTFFSIWLITVVECCSLFFFFPFSSPINQIKQRHSSCLGNRWEQAVTVKIDLPVCAETASLPFPFSLQLSVVISLAGRSRRGYRLCKHVLKVIWGVHVAHGMVKHERRTWRVSGWLYPAGLVYTCVTLLSEAVFCVVLVWLDAFE